MIQDVQLKVQTAYVVGQSMIDALEREDKGRVRSRHKSSIEILRREMSRYQLEAERAGLEVEEPKSSGLIRWYLMETIKAFILTLALISIFMLLGAMI